MNDFMPNYGRIPLLGADDEKTLARAIAAGDSAARTRMILANLRLVVDQARRFKGRGVDVDDLVSEGFVGLIRAVELFDPDMNTRFSTYATHWIKQSITRGIQNTSRTVRVPAYMHERLAKARRESAEELGELPKGRMGRLMLRNLRRVELHDSEDGFIFNANLVARDASPEAEVDEADQREHVEGLLAQLEPTAAAVLRARFGIGAPDGEEETTEALGKRLGITRERVRQIEAAAMAKLRGELRASAVA